MKTIPLFILVLVTGVCAAFAADSAKQASGSAAASSSADAGSKSAQKGTSSLRFVRNTTGLEFIDSSFENASPVWYEEASDRSIQVHLRYDQGRASPNRSAGHVHILLHAKPGAKLTLEFLNLENVRDGIRRWTADSIKLMVVSENGRDWKPVPTDIIEGKRLRLTVEMTGPRLYVARVEPYRLSDLDGFLASIAANPLVQITPIGKTVQGRTLEIVRVGNPQAPYRAFLRARAHPWEPGGNWIVQGLIRRLMAGDAAAKTFLGRYCVYVMPMANKDGVVHGFTRFNPQGKDLNRDWDRPADERFAPENAALEKWLEGMIAAGHKPHLAIELHNDGAGRLHTSRLTGPELPRYLERMARLEALLRQHTWFTEGFAAGFGEVSTLGDGWQERYQIDAVVHEFNSNWIEGLQDYPSGKHWETYGANLATVFHEYFGSLASGR